MVQALKSREISQMTEEKSERFEAQGRFAVLMLF